MKPTPKRDSKQPRRCPAPYARISLALWCVLLGSTLCAADPGQPGKNLGDLSIEELMNETVTSVSKKEQRLGDSAAAIAVLSNDDLRRSGAVTLTDALRLVPGLDVGTVDSSHAAVSARGFNNQFSNKVLVLIDGRAVYNPIFAGTSWDLQQMMLEDVDRVEVIRGPGATVWGANAVNGVINVVSRSARETQGGFLYGGGGNVHQVMGGARYGGQTDANTYYRVFGSYQLNADNPLADGRSADDGWQGWSGGFRADRYPDANSHLTWQADATKSDLDDHQSDTYNVNTLGRWSRQLSDRSGIEVQAYYDRTYLNEVEQARVTGDTIDLTAQHTLGLGERNDAIWGLGYRFNREAIAQMSPYLLVRHSHFSLHLYSAFLQDEFKFIPEKLILTGGLKIEHNDYTGFEFQPSVRVVFKPGSRQTVWAAISRAVRTPDATEGKDVFGIQSGAPFPGPGGGLYIPTVTGNGSPSSEVVWAYETGYRVQPTQRVSFDLAAFYNEYRGLTSPGAVARFVPGVPFGTAEIPLLNLLNARTYGAEVSAVVSPTDTWRLTAGYALLRTAFSGPAVANPEAQERTSPRHQITLRSAYDFPKRVSLDVQIRSVSGIEMVPPYVTADVRLSYRPNDRLELSLVGQNLLDPQHLEQPTSPQTVSSEVPRGFYGKSTWRF